MSGLLSRLSVLVLFCLCVLITHTTYAQTFPAPGTITTIAGNGATGYSGDGGAAINAANGFPNGLAVDRQNNLTSLGRELTSSVK